MKQFTSYLYAFATAYIICNAAPPHYLSICSMITNFPEYERHWNDTEEWIEYHRMMGVDHFFLYPHQCTKDFLDKLHKYEEEGIVTLVFLVINEPRTHFCRLRHQTLRHHIKQYGHLTRWCAFIDDDEFILPQHYNSIPEFLQPYDASGFNKVRILWHCFGSSGWYQLPKERLLTESLYQCIDYEMPHEIQGLHKHEYKEIVKPAFVESAKNHYSPMKREKSLEPSKSEIQINHYVMRSDYFATHIKRKRNANSQRKMAQSTIHHYNASEDWSIQKWVPALKQRLQERRSHSL